MIFQELRPVLWTDKLQESIDFYIEKLGFSCRERNDEWGWAALQKDKVEIMLALPNEHTSFVKPVFTGSLYIRTDDVETIWRQLKDQVKIAYPIQTYEWEMREFAVYDNNGYLLQFGQDLSV